MIGQWGRNQRRWRCETARDASAPRSDAELLGALRRGSRDALSRLYDRYSPFVFTLARLAQPAEAEELTEEVFLDLWRRRDHLRAASPLSATLIALTLDDAGSLDAGGGAGSPRLSGNAGKTLAPFTRLPAPAREVLLLTCLGGLGTREIAVALGISEASVSRIFTAGMKQVREVEHAP